MNETFEAMSYIFHDIIDNNNMANHFKRLKVLNFVLSVLKKLCRMQKLIQDELRKQGIMPLIIKVCELMIKEAKAKKELKNQNQEEINVFLKEIIALLVNFVTANKMNQGIKIIKAVFKAINKAYDKQQDNLAEKEVIENQEKLTKQKSKDQQNIVLKDDDDVKSIYSEVKSDIFDENQEKLLIQINEWFTLIFIMLSHNRNGKELAKNDSEDELSEDDMDDEDQSPFQLQDPDTNSNKNEDKKDSQNQDQRAHQERIMNRDLANFQSYSVDRSGVFHTSQRTSTKKDPRYNQERTLFPKIFNNFLMQHELDNSMKEPVEVPNTQCKNAKFASFDCSEYDGGGLYDDQGDQNFPEMIYYPGKLQTRLLLFYSDVIQELVDSDNDKFEDLYKFVKKEAILFMADLLRKYIGFYKNGYLIDDFVRFVYDKNLISAQLDLRRNFLFPPMNQSQKQQQLDEKNIKQVDICDKLRIFQLQIMDSMLGIIEIFSNICAFGDRADEFKQLLNDAGMLEYSLNLMKHLKDTTDILIEHKIYEPEEKFATFTSKTKQRHPFGGFLSKVANLIANLTYLSDAGETVFRKNKEFLAIILYYTKIDEDNPTLREWCLLVIRNLCQSSEKIRSDLEKMNFIDIDTEGKKTLEKIGLKEMYDKEMKKLQKRDGDKRQFDKI
eukprot:403342709